MLPVSSGKKVARCLGKEGLLTLRLRNISTPSREKVARFFWERRNATAAAKKHQYFSFKRKSR